jgi:hypothetical protein
MEHEPSGHEVSEQPSKHRPVIEKIRESLTDPIYVGALRNRVRLRIGDQWARTVDMSPDEARLLAHSLLEATEGGPSYAEHGHDVAARPRRQQTNRQKRRVVQPQMKFVALIAVLFLLAGCSTASTQYKSRPFFLTEEEVTTHGRKAWYDRFIELDPGKAEFTVAPDYQRAPPKKIAVLPFTDLGDGEFVVDKIPVIPRSDQERARWGWSHANHLRRGLRR